MATTGPSVWDAVVGQERAVARLVASAAAPVHAYLFVGPPGSTKDAAARAFAALVLAGGVDDPDDRHARLALRGEHPDVREVRRLGAALSAEQIDEIVRAASMTPVEADRTVMILDELHLLQAHGAARLLKTIEEPPPNTLFVVLADQVTNDLVTIASRCVRVDFAPLPPELVRERLVAEGVDPARAGAAAAASAGDLDRARVLATDDGLARRREVFASVPRRLTGFGAAAVDLAQEIAALCDEATASLAGRHARELADLDARVAATGERGAGRKSLEDRHKREVRRYRTDELRAGLAVIAGTYRDAVVAGSTEHHDAAARAVHRVHRALEALERNPNELLLLQAMLLDLPSLPPTPVA